MCPPAKAFSLSSALSLPLGVPSSVYFRSMREHEMILFREEKLFFALLSRSRTKKRAKVFYY
jgi:hypothetical protein